jgi:hypothetical protein
MIKVISLGLALAGLFGFAVAAGEAPAPLPDRLPPLEACSFCEVPCSLEDSARDNCGSGTCSYERPCSPEERQALLEEAHDADCFAEGEISMFCNRLRVQLGFTYEFHQKGSNDERR